MGSTTHSFLFQSAESWINKELSRSCSKHGEYLFILSYNVENIYFDNRVVFSQRKRTGKKNSQLIYMISKWYVNELSLTQFSNCVFVVMDKSHINARNKITTSYTTFYSRISKRINFLCCQKDCQLPYNLIKLSLHIW